MLYDPDERELHLRDIVKHGRRMENEEEDSEDSLKIKGGEPSIEDGTPILEFQKHKKTKDDKGMLKQVILFIEAFNQFKQKRVKKGFKSKGFTFKKKQRGKKKEEESRGVRGPIIKKHGRF